ncbi:unnamed protein product [Pleuronectes platessa]|uniref:Uncharacterized protein n=1 Tax=Pleuronectes platessa TaxID=8262 RepID=A0A9N7UCZ7_PLEPL|nr:unnamed protein product [Pleuronectes platessa]
MSRFLFISWGLEPEEGPPVLHILEVFSGVSTFCFRLKTPIVSADRAFSDSQAPDKMTSLTAKDKETVKAFWAKMASKAQDIGADTSSWLLWLWPWLRNTDRQQEKMTESAASALSA